MAKLLSSFDELSRIFKNPTKAAAICSKASYLAIKSKIGETAAIVWGFLQDQESCKRYGPNGSILHTPESISHATQYAQSDVVSALIQLIQSGHARYSPAGLVKAA